MPSTSDTPFTLRDLRFLAEIQDACIHNYPVRWAQDSDPSQVVDGVARAFCNEDGSFFDSKKDVREAFIWISGMVERFMPVMEIMYLMERDLFFVHPR